MKWLIIAVLVLAQQPAKSPERKGAAKNNNANSTATQEPTKSNQSIPTQPAPISSQTPIGTEGKIVSATHSNAASTNNPQTSSGDLAIQRKLVWFTGALVIVGVLQGIVMYLTWRVYRRQANEMRRQRHEMVRQRTEMTAQRKAMESQLEIMNGQLAQMEGAGKQTDQLIEQAKKQTKELHDATDIALAHAEAAADTAKAAKESANAALLNANAYQTAERAWITMTGVDTMEFINSTVPGIAGKVSGVAFVFKWLNSGRTTATGCSFLTMWRAVKNGEPIPTFVEPTENIETVIAPMTPNGVAQSAEMAVPQGDIDLLKKREGRVFIYCRVDYDTVYFAERRHTEVCAEVEYGGTDRTNNKDIYRFRVRGSQNSAT